MLGVKDREKKKVKKTINIEIFLEERFKEF